MSAVVPVAELGIPGVVLMEIVDLRLDDLILDPTLNLRDRLDPETVERYQENWDRLPPVTVFEVDGRWILADGFHRHAAAVTLGRRVISAEIRKGSFSEALDYAAGANLRHGLPMSRAERRRAVEVKLRLHHALSDRQLSEDLGVGRELIAKVRRQLVDAGQIPDSATRVGADGKVYPASYAKDPNEHLPRTNIEGGADPESRGRSSRDRAGWDDTVDPLPPLAESSPQGQIVPPWEDDPNDPRALAEAPIASGSAPTIDEMLALMARQVQEVIQWTLADGFPEGYQSASPSARDLFQQVALQLAARAEQLR